MFECIDDQKQLVDETENIECKKGWNSFCVSLKRPPFLSFVWYMEVVGISSKNITIF